MTRRTQLGEVMENSNSHKLQDTACPPVEEKPRCGRPPEMEECVRRERILEAACKVLQKHGYHGASMDKVAECSGMSKRTLYKMFPSKLELFQILIRDRLFDVRPQVAPEATTAEEELTSLLIDLARTILRPDRISLIRAIITESSESEDVREIIATLETGGEDNALETWLQAYCRQHGYARTNVRSWGKMLFGMTVGDFIFETLGCAQKPLTCDVIQHRTGMAVRIFLSGLKSIHPA
ncbi:TetR/AcrR family transcriptional regulator [Novacetimonas pomaceti]|uniref:TetR/AcrR family transcriptional regulator n=1 Tax=Novacetimonas pomaceti TaxID=2021998 RepID=UPI001EF1018C|nr:TetR/AcrR family transcriptional regulator [Novacetimonas pomaceti]